MIAHDILAPDDPRHGTINGYGNLRCRCPRCTEANRIHHKAWMDAHPEHRLKAAANEAAKRHNLSPEDAMQRTLDLRWRREKAPEIRTIVRMFTTPLVSRREIAEEAGISRQGVEQIMAGRALPSRPFLMACVRLGIPVADEDLT